MIKEKTKEYKDVLDYMENVIGNEFPTAEFTPYHLILSIFDSNKCHANIIMDNVLMSDTMDSLREYYSKEISSLNTKPIIQEKKGSYDKELQDILTKTDEEAEHAKAKKVGSEHIMLALLNPNNTYPSSQEMLRCGLHYDYISKQAEVFKEENTKNDSRRYVHNNSKTNAKIPLKSEIHSKTFLSTGDTPYIKKYTINLHEELTKGYYDTLVGRENILKNIIKVLSRRKKNNVILVGKPGTGKTSLAYKLAELIESGNVPDILSEKRVIMLDPMALVSGTHLRGMFEERVDGLFRELKNNPNYILFIDDMQNVIRTGNKTNDGDLTDMIGNILSAGDIRVVGAISFKEYRNGIESNSALSTKLQKIIVEPSTKEETFDILKANKVYYEKFHHIKFDDKVLYKAINLAKRYITNNSLPDSALDIIDLTGASISLTKKEEKSIKSIKKKLSSFDGEKSKAMDSGDFELLDEIAKKESALYKELNDIKRDINNDDSTWVNVTEEDIAETVSTMTNIPISKLKASEKETILHIDEILKKDVIGQDEAINEISKAIKRARAGFGDKSKVMATLLCIGSSGCGKCVSGDTLVRVRSKKTGEIREMPIKELKNLGNNE